MKTAISALVAAVTLAVMSAAQADDTRRDSRHGTVTHGYSGQHGGYRAHRMEGLPEINMRQSRQRERIEHGFHVGAITRWEFRRLMAEQQDIRAMERAYVADGFLSPRERMELNRRLDMASTSIRFEASDHQRRF